MTDLEGHNALGFDFKVYATSGRGHSPEELADMAMERLLEVSEDADPMVKAQAMVFKDRIHALMVEYMRRAIASDRTTVCAQLLKQGHGDMAQIISKL